MGIFSNYSANFRVALTNPLQRISAFIFELAKVLWSARLHVFITFFLYLVFWYTPQGHDLLIALPESGRYGHQRIIWVLLDVSLLGLLQWFIARYVFEINYDSQDTPTLRSRIEKYVPRVFGVLSILVLAFGMFNIHQTYAPNFISRYFINNWGGWSVSFFLSIITVITSIGLVLVSDRLLIVHSSKLKNYILRGALGLFAILTILLALDIILEGGQHLPDPDDFLLLSGLIFLLGVILCVLITIRKEPQFWHTRIHGLSIRKIMAYILMPGVVITFLIYNIVPAPYLNLQWIYPTSILFSGVGFYTVVISLIMRKGQKMKVYLLGGVLLLLFFSSGILNNQQINIELFNARLLEQTSVEQDTRPSLEAYFQEWVIDRQEEIDAYYETHGAPYPMFVVAAQGGGSRAAYWTNNILSMLHDTTHGKFTEHCFAISAVSGSAYGTAAYVSFLREWIEMKEQRPNEYPFYFVFDENRQQGRDLLGYNWKAFSGNHLSSTLAYLLGRDFWQNAVPGIYWAFRGEDRAAKLEQEWTLNVNSALRTMINPEEAQANDLSPHDHKLPHQKPSNQLPPLSTSQENQQDQSYGHPIFFPSATQTLWLDQPFTSFWNVDEPQTQYTIPLFFSNVTRAEDGKRSVVSAVQIDTNFVEALDILRELPLDKTLRLSTATLLSARAPYINPGGKIDDLGYFVDGGYYENIGANTALEILKVCKTAIEDYETHPDSSLRKTFSRLKPHAILIYNGAHTLKSGKEVIGPVRNRPQLLIPMQGLDNTRRSHTRYFAEALVNYMDEGAAVDTFQLYHDIKLPPTVPGLDSIPVIMPISRFLSRTAANAIASNIAWRNNRPTFERIVKSVNK